MGNVAAQLLETLRGWTLGKARSGAAPSPHLPLAKGSPTPTMPGPKDRDGLHKPHDGHGRGDRHIAPVGRSARRGAAGEALLPLSPQAELEAGPAVTAEPPLPLEGFDAAAEQRQILAQQLSPTIQTWVAAYRERGGRGLYLWQWCQHGLELITLPCVQPELRAHLRDTKLLAVILGVLLDDVADRGGAEHVLHELLAIIRQDRPPDMAHLDGEQRDYAQFTQDMWEAIAARLAGYPCYAEHAALLDFDHWQIANTMQYAWLVNRRPALLNLAEHDVYLPHNMQMMSFVTMDLMASPSFRREELGVVREIAWHAQSMGRIGNLLSTWERELADRDFTSAVFVRALRHGDVTPEELARPDATRLAEAVRRGRHEAHFLDRWRQHRASIVALARTVRSFDVQVLLAGLDRLIGMELLSRGLK